MTREEIKNTPELVDFMLDESVIADSREKLRKRLEKVCNLAIKALEQEPILDKIRAEIEYIGGDDEKAFCKNLNESYKQGLKDALKVIDKYKPESEK